MNYDPPYNAVTFRLERNACKRENIIHIDAERTERKRQKVCASHASSIRDKNFHKQGARHSKTQNEAA